MQDKENKSFETESVTPIIQDLEGLTIRIFQFLRSVLFNIFNVVYLIIKESILAYRIVIPVVLISGLIGFFSIKISPRNYSSSLTLKTQFDSRNQLYNDAIYLNSLVQNKNYVGLATVLKVDEETASTISKIEIAPVKNDFDKAKNISRLQSNMDTSALDYINKKDIQLSNAPDYYSNHELKIYSTNSSVFGIIETPLLAFIENKEELKETRLQTLKSLSARKKSLMDQLARIDSLQQVLNKSSLLRAQNTSTGGTNISMGKNELSNDVDRVDLFRLTDEYQYLLEKTESGILDAKSIYKVVGHLNPEGSKVLFGEKGRAATAGLIGYSICILILIIRRATKK